MGGSISSAGAYGANPYASATRQPSAQLPADWQFLANSPMVGAPSFSDLTGALQERSNRGIPNDGFSVNSGQLPTQQRPPSSVPRQAAPMNFPPGFGSVATGSYGIPNQRPAAQPDSRTAAIRSMASQTATVGLPDINVLKALMGASQKAAAPEPPPKPAFDPMQMIMLMMVMKKRK